MSKYTFCPLSYQYSRKSILASNCHIKGVLLKLKLHLIGKARKSTSPRQVERGKKKKVLISKSLFHGFRTGILVLDSMYWKGQISK